MNVFYNMNRPDMIRHTKARQSEFITRLSPPETLGGRKFSDLAALACRGTTGEKGKYSVYMIVTPDFSMGRLGEGLPDRFWHHINAYFWHQADEGWRQRQVETYLSGRRDYLRLKNNTKSYQPMDPGLIGIIHRSGDHLYWVLLADGLTKAQSAAGEQAIFHALGIRCNGGWLVNQSYR
jgi:hypothetical protein